MDKQARIVGDVTYREGDGPHIPIPRGPCTIEETQLDVTISWEEGDTRGSTAMPVADFKRYVAHHAIEVTNASRV